MNNIKALFEWQTAIVAQDDHYVPDPELIIPGSKYVVVTGDDAIEDLGVKVGDTLTFKTFVYESHDSYRHIGIFIVDKQSTATVRMFWREVKPYVKQAY